MATSRRRRIGRLVEQLEREKSALKAHRDKLQQLMEEVEEEVSKAGEGVGDLQRAIDTLSRQA